MIGAATITVAGLLLIAALTQNPRRVQFWAFWLVIALFLLLLDSAFGADLLKRDLSPPQAPSAVLTLPGMEKRSQEPPSAFPEPSLDVWNSNLALK